MTGELSEVAQVLVQQAVHDRQINIEVPVHEHVAETGDGAESLGEGGGQRAVVAARSRLQTRIPSRSTL